MIPSTRLAIILACSAAALLIAAWVVALVRRRRKSPAEVERLRRLDINRRGRITSARIVDFIEPEPHRPGPRLIAYKYELAGVTYEAAQDVSALAGVLPLARRATDQVASVKYDPKVPTNSIIVCEDWCGFPSAQTRVARESRPLKASEKALKQP